MTDFYDEAPEKTTRRFKVVAEMRANFDVGIFEAESAAAAMEAAQESTRYYRISRMPGMGGVYDLRASPLKESQ